MRRDIPIEEFSYPLPTEKIAKFPLEKREESKLLICDGNEVKESRFKEIVNLIEPNSVVVFNNTKVIHARLMFFKPTGGKIEIFCLEPHSPADHERAFASKNGCRWLTLVGGRKKWKEGSVECRFNHNGSEIVLKASVVEHKDKESIVDFSWNCTDLTFGEVLHLLGKIPIPPYLCRESEESDSERYQTVYSKIEGSVAAPTAGLHFTTGVINGLKERGCSLQEVTLHVGAGTFLPVKSDNAADHTMHIEHFGIDLSTLEKLAASASKVVAVGTTSVRTIESLSVLGHRVVVLGTPNLAIPVGQWEAYDIDSSVGGSELLGALASWMRSQNLTHIEASTQIMITPGYNFKVAGRIVTNFHQPQSTLLLLISAAIGEKWKEVYNYALNNNFRFLSYGDSSILTINNNRQQ